MSESNKARKSHGVTRYKYVTAFTLGHGCFRSTDQKTLILFMKKDLHRKHHSPLIVLYFIYFLFCKLVILIILMFLSSRIEIQLFFIDLNVTF